MFTASSVSSVFVLIPCAQKRMSSLDRPLSDLAHNLLRAAGTLAGQPHAVARSTTLRHNIVNILARNADLCCIFPATGLGLSHGSRCGTTQSAGIRHHFPPPPDQPPQGPTGTTKESWLRPADHLCPYTKIRSSKAASLQRQPIGGFRVSVAAGNRIGATGTDPAGQANARRGWRRRVG